MPIEILGKSAEKPSVFVESELVYFPLANDWPDIVLQLIKASEHQKHDQRKNAVKFSAVLPGHRPLRSTCFGVIAGQSW